MSKYRVILISFLIAIIGWTCGHNGDGHIMNWESSKAEDPQECFDVYLPKINQATLTYEQEYSKCIQAAETSIGAIESEISSDRADIYYEAEGVCALFQDCYDLDLSLHFFECYYKAVSELLYHSSASSLLIPPVHIIQRPKKLWNHCIQFRIQPTIICNLSI